MACTVTWRTPSCRIPGGFYMASEQDNAAFEAWAAEQDKPDGHPIVATIVGAVAILMGVGGNPRPPAAGDLPTILGGVTGVTLLVWGIAFAITIRRASLGWKIGSFAILWVLCLLATLGSIGRRVDQATRKDMAGITEIRIDKNNKLVLPESANRGPISQIMLTFFRSINEEAEARDRALLALGIDRIADARAIASDPKLLRNCGRFAAARPLVEGTRTRFQRHVAKLTNDINAGDFDANVKGGILEGLNTKGLERKLDLGTGLSLEQLDEAVSLCTVLAKRHWQLNGGSFVFSSNADMESYNKHVVRWNALLSQAQTIQAEGRASMIEGQRKISEGIR